ncbi:hypothetical protein HK099_001860 [Clydaea vesicula]|uniref:SH3 domain-containing protein n=1 Tax=Clydaea vesicula TaxID=447962 RepID=A0AAD5TTJ0_9FUNG|nr:hypothetical protein HK099_001860 [Clydaea vesicula]
MASGQCFYISNDTPCGPQYGGFPILISAFPTQAEFIQSLNVLTSESIRDTLVTNFGCTAGDALTSALHNRQFHVSFACSLDIDNAMKAGCTIDPILAGNPGATVGPVLCESQCQSAKSTLSNILNNPEACPNTATPEMLTARSTVVNEYESYCTNAKTAADTQGGLCVTGAPHEIANCGFETEEFGRTGCGALTGNTCCTEKGWSAITGNTSPTSPLPTSKRNPPQQPNSTASTAANTSLVSSAVNSKTEATGMPMGLIAAVIVGSVIIVIVIAFIFFCQKKKNNKKVVDKKNEKNKNLNDNQIKVSDIVSKPDTNFDSVSYIPNNDYKAAISKNQFQNQTPQINYQRSSPTPTPPQINYPSSPQMNNNNYPSSPQMNNNNYQSTSQMNNNYQTSQQLNNNTYPSSPQMNNNIYPSSPKMNNNNYPSSPQMNNNFQNFNDHPYERSANNNFHQEKVFHENYPENYRGGGSPQPPVNYLQKSPSVKSDSRKDSPRASPNKIPYEEIVNEVNSEGEMMIVVHPYYPTLADELHLDVGADLVMIRSFDDGWALGLNPITGQQGAFPVVCVAKPREAATLRERQNGTQRISYLPEDPIYNNRISSQLYTKENIQNYNENFERSIGKEQISQPKVSKQPTVSQFYGEYYQESEGGFEHDEEIPASKTVY